MWLRVLAAILFLLIKCSYAETKFLAISDIHYGHGNNSLQGSDAGDDLLNLAMSKTKELSKEVGFILVLGDLPTHSNIQTTQRSGFEEKVFSSLYKADVYKKPMFYVPGNNDSLNGNYQPFQAKGLSPLNFAKNWSGSCVYCRGLEIDSSHMKKGGYYSTYVTPGNKNVILIVLNSVQWTRVPFVLPDYPNQVGDAEEQLQWLEQQLKKHHAKQLLIAMHVPPGASYLGFNFWHPTYVKRFVSLLKTYQGSYDEISLITSHTHRDGFRKIILEKGQPIYAYAVPSVSRVYLNNPGMKIFELDSNYKMSNFTTYYTSMLETWGTSSYKGRGDSQSIFPECRTTTLATCLNRFSKDEVCEHIDRGMFYTVKSPLADSQDKSCGLVYHVALW